LATIHAPNPNSELAQENAQGGGGGFDRKRC
jgi:hypothetical protein